MVRVFLIHTMDPILLFSPHNNMFETSLNWNFFIWTFFYECVSFYAFAF